MDCRTVLAADEPCDGGRHHRVRDLAEPTGRAALVSEVWGPPSARRRAREIARAGGTGAGVGAGSQALDCGGCGTGSCDVGDAAGLGQALMVLVVIVAAALVAIALYYLVKWIVLYVRRKMNEPRAKGALARAPAFVGTIARGRVSGPAELTSPMSGEPCVALGLELAERRSLARQVMLRDATTSGFDVTLDDGRKARVPAGRIRLEGEARRRARSDATGLDGYLGRLDPLRVGEVGSYDPIPFDEAAETLLRPGDAVELIGDLAPVADPTREGGYRDAAMILAPASVPRVRKA